MKYRLALCVAGLVGCGEVKDVNHLPDAPPAPDDADDAEVAPVTVTVLTYLADGLPDPTARVVFQGPDNAIVFEGMVDAAGKISAVMPVGGSVTEVRIVMDTTTTLQAALTTITGVKPGDDLVFGRKAAPINTTGGGATTMTATFTAVPNATSYEFFTTCGKSTAIGSPVTINFRDSCHGSTFDLLGVTVGVVPPRFVRVANIAYTSGGSFAVPNAFQSTGTYTINTANMPADVDSFTVSRASMIEHSAVGAQTAAYAGNPPAGFVASTVPFAPGVGTRSEVGLTLGRRDASTAQRHEVHTANLAASIDVDLAQHALPWLTDPVPTPTGATWTLLAPGGTPDGMVVQWSGRWTDGVKTTTVSWRVAAPAVGIDTGFTLPRLPASYMHLDPQAQTLVVTPILGALFMADYDVVAGYDQLRAMPDTLLEPTIDKMGAFVGMPWQRRYIFETFR